MYGAMNNPFASEEWSLDQVLIWIAERDTTPWFLEARALDEEWKNAQPWFTIGAPTHPSAPTPLSASTALKTPSFAGYDKVV